MEMPRALIDSKVHPIRKSSRKEQLTGRETAFGNLVRHLPFTLNGRLSRLTLSTSGQRTFQTNFPPQILLSLAKSGGQQRESAILSSSMGTETEKTTPPVGTGD